MLGVSSLIRKSHLALPAMSAYHCLQLVFLYKELIGQANSRKRECVLPMDQSRASCFSFYLYMTCLPIAQRLASTFLQWMLSGDPVQAYKIK